MDASRSKRAVSIGHLERRNVFGAERDDGVGSEFRRHAEAVGHLADRIGSDAVGQAVVARVRRHPSRALERTRAVVDAVEVVNLQAVRKRERVAAVQRRFRAYALLDCGRKREHLERGACGTSALGGDVPLVRIEVLAADDGLDVAVRGVHGDERAVQPVFHRVVLRSACVVGLVLQAHVKRRVDLQPTLEQVGIRAAVDVVGLHELVAHVAREVRVRVDALCGLVGGGIEHELFGHCLVVFVFRDVAGREHAFEHEVAALDAGLRVLFRVEPGRRLRDADKGGCLCQGQVLRRLLEIVVCSGLDPIAPVTVVDGVQVHVEDLFLRVLLLELQCKFRFAGLSLECDVRRLFRQRRVAHELLGDS